MARALLLTSTGNPAGHPYPQTAPLMQQIVEAVAETITEFDLARLESDGALAEFDVVVLHGQYGSPPNGRQLVERLERYVHEGGGLVVVHIASSSFEGDARFRRLVGRVWEYFYQGPPFTSDHPPVGPYDVEPTAESHPITEGMETFRLEQDERYERLLVAPDASIVDLATATIDGRTESVAWVLTPSGGRVFHVTPGHDVSTYTNSDFQGLMQRGIVWAGTGE